MNDFQILLSAVIDQANAQTKLNAQISKLKTEAIKLGVTIDDKTAKQAIQKLSKDQDTFYKKNLSAIDLETKKRTEQSNINSKQIKSQLQERVAAENKIQADILKTAKVQQSALNLKSGKVQFSNNIENYLKTNTKLSTELQNKLLEIQSKIKSVDKTQLNNLKNEFKEVTGQANVLGQTGSTVLGKFKSDIGNFLTFVTAGGAVMSVITTFKNMVEEVTNVNSAMISLKKVTNETNSAYDTFLTNSTQKAKELGSSISDLIEATADFARLGYTLSDAAGLGEVATLYKNVGDGIDISGATESIISTMKAFDIQAKDSITIIDKYNEVGNNFAISSAGIGNSLQNSAAALVEAGNTIDQAIALTVAANNVVQDPESVGNMWKTVSMRIRGAKTELEDAGLEIDGMASSTSELRDEIKALTGGFDIMIDDSTFKSTYDIILGISEVYDKLTDTSQANILEMLAGKRQGNQLAAALGNAEDLVSVLNASEQSAGSALKEQEAYTKGIQYSMDRMSASFQELSTITLDSSVVKFFVDLANSILNAITAIGGLVPVVATLSASFILMKTGILPTLIGQIGMLMLAQTGYTASTVGAAFAQVGLTGAIKATTTAMATFLLTNPVGWAILAASAVGGLVVAYNHFNVTLEEHQAKLEELKGAYDSTTSDVKTLEEQLKVIQDRMTELQKINPLTFAEDGEYEKLSNSNDQLERRLTIQKELQKIAGKQAEEEAVKTISATSEHSLNTANYQTVTSSEGISFVNETKVTRNDAIKERIDAYNDLGKEIDSIEEKQLNLANAGKTESAEYKNLSNSLKDINSKRDEYYSYVVTNMDTLNTESDSIVSATSEGKKYAEMIKGLSINVDTFIN